MVRGAAERLTAALRRRDAKVSLLVPLRIKGDKIVHYFLNHLRHGLSRSTTLRPFGNRCGISVVFFPQLSVAGGINGICFAVPKGVGLDSGTRFRRETSAPVNTGKKMRIAGLATQDRGQTALADR